MCLGIPGKVVRWVDHDPTFGRAEVEFDGVRRVCHMACVPDAVEGDYVVVHAGIAISRINEVEARRVLEDLRQLAMMEPSDASPGDQPTDISDAPTNGLADNIPDNRRGDIDRGESR